MKSNDQDNDFVSFTYVRIKEKKNVEKKFLFWLRKRLGFPLINESSIFFVEAGMRDGRIVIGRGNTLKQAWEEIEEKIK
jgi:hypothetical protein